MILAVFHGRPPGGIHSILAPASFWWQSSSRWAPGHPSFGIDDAFVRQRVSPKTCQAKTAATRLRPFSKPVLATHHNASTAQVRLLYRVRFARTANSIASIVNCWVVENIRVMVSCIAVVPSPQSPTRANTQDKSQLDWRELLQTKPPTQPPEWRGTLASASV